MQSTAIATQAAESDFRDAVRIFTNMVRDAYYGLVQAQKNRWLAQEIVAYYKDIVNDNRLRYQAGDIAESDFMRIEMEEMRAKSDLDNAQAGVEQAQAAVAQILNWSDKSLDFVAAEQWPQFADIGQTLKREAMINKALALRPDLLGDKQRADQAEKDLIRAMRLKYPDLTFNAGQARDPSNTVLNTFFLGVSAQVPLFYQFKGEENQALVNLNQMRVAAEQTELGVRADVVNALATWNSSNKVVQRFETELLDRALKVRERMELAYRKGGTTVLDFIDAQRDYKAVMLDYYTAAVNRVNAYYDLAKAMGVEPDAELTKNTANPMAISTERQRKIQ
jgi:cobalt-zinc-cadmium efflux system outer membrane protein